MHKLITFGLVALLIFSSCAENNICQLSGSLDNIDGNTYLYLADIKSFKIIDSILVVNGKFNYQLSLAHPKLFLLHKKVDKSEFRDHKFIWLEPSEISLKGDFNFMKNIKLEGSNSHIEYRQYNLIVDSLSRQIAKMKDSLAMYCFSKKTRFIEGHLSNLPDSVISDNKYQYLKSKFDSLGVVLANKMISFLSSHPNSFVTLYTLHSESYFLYLENHIHKRYLNKEQIDMVYEKLSNDLKYSEKGLKIKKYIDLPQVPQIGDKAPNIIQKTPDGKTIRLSNFRGQYVLIDFWSSWCGPCRASFRELKEVYKKYHPLGLEIIGQGNRV